MSEADLLFMEEDIEDDEDDEPEMVEYRANFTRNAYVTEYASITFEAPEDADDDELDSLAWEAARSSRYGLEWEPSGDWDSGDEEIDSIEEN